MKPNILVLRPSDTGGKGYGWQIYFEGPGCKRCIVMQSPDLGAFYNCGSEAYAAGRRAIAGCTYYAVQYRSDVR